MRRLVPFVLLPLILLALHRSASAHCEIPCGIYGDEARFSAIAENLKTIEKSMNQIVLLSADAGKNMNQLVRWVNNKESHADQIREIVAQYFLAQRIKAPANGDPAARKAYTEKLALLHQMIVSAMKCKQTTDTAHVKKSRELLRSFEALYMKN
ncbi:MAG: superoxide dismutase [Gemmatimonadetes bacterium]|nr:superoxide dismutase [Gemmatimonadota bacterium]MDE3257175.1 superoxide dismutase [Gemmatimonadota bacterium]